MRELESLQLEGQRRTSPSLCKGGLGSFVKRKQTKLEDLFISLLFNVLQSNEMNEFEGEIQFKLMFVMRSRKGGQCL